MDILFGHYGLDWLAAACTMLALYRLGNTRRDGFVLGMTSNLLWLSFGLLVVSSATVFANVVFFALNLRGFLRWAGSPGSPPPGR